MRWIKGNELNDKQVELVKSAYGYRWTIENEHRAREWYGKMSLPTVPLDYDKFWLIDHCFQFVNDGSRLGTSRHCEMAYCCSGLNWEIV
jgi:hypothetical protein